MINYNIYNNVFIRGGDMWKLLSDEVAFGFIIPKEILLIKLH